MRTNRFFFYSLLLSVMLLFVSEGGSLFAQTENDKQIPNPKWAGEIATIQSRTNKQILKKAKWHRKKIRKGLKVSTCVFDTLYGVPQYLSMLEINPRYYRFEFVDHKGMRRTSEVAKERGEIAAFNGTFYDMKLGNSVAYLQINGSLIDTSRHDDIYPQINGALRIEKGKIEIVDWSPQIESSKRANIEPDISYMAAQPMLIREGKTQIPLADMPGFNVKKHNRSVLFTKGRRVYFLVVDGRAKGFAEGMSIAELCDLLPNMGARNALNMDGGGSSTLYLSEPYGGSNIVNMPSDNHRFDHEGERSISNHIAVMLK